MHRLLMAEYPAVGGKRPPNIEFSRMAWPLHLKRPWINDDPVLSQDFGSGP
jgi:hypothetical protein